MFRDLKRSYFKKIFVFSLAMNLIMLFITEAIFGFIFYKKYTANIRRQMTETVEYINNTLHKVIFEYTASVNDLSVSKDVADYFNGTINEDAEKRIVQNLYFIKNTADYKADISIFDPHGKKLLSTGIKDDNENLLYRTDWGVFRHANASEHAVVYSFARDAIFNASDRICIASAYRNGEIVYGYILAEISRTTLYEIISEYASAYNTHLMILNKNGSVIFDSGGTAFEGLGKLERYGLQNILKRTSAMQTFEENGYLCAFSQENALYVVQEFPANAISTIVSAMQNTFLFVLICIALLGFLFSAAIARTVVRPITDLQKTMSRVCEGDFSAKVPVLREDEIGKLGETFNSMTEKITELLVNIDEEKHSLWIAETRSLNLQMNPHFLYNTLDLIKWNAKLGRMKEISDITVNLGRLLRRVMNTKNDLVTVAYELEIVRSFIEIQKKHYGSRLQLETDIPADLEQMRIPKLVLQPIAENAVVHGFASKPGNCRIKISGDEEDEFLRFIVEDNGAGMSENVLESILGFRQNNTHHIGLNNVDRRAKLYGGDSCGLQVESTEGIGTKVVLILKKIPINPNPDSEV